MWMKSRWRELAHSGEWLRASTCVLLVLLDVSLSYLRASTPGAGLSESLLPTSVMLHLANFSFADPQTQGLQVPLELQLWRSRNTTREIQGDAVQQSRCTGQATRCGVLEARRRCFQLEEDSSEHRYEFYASISTYVGHISSKWRATFLGHRGISGGKAEHGLDDRPWTIDQSERVGRYVWNRERPCF